MKVIFPDGHHLNLKGHVRWLDKNNPGYYRIGLQFQAFGRGVHYNPLKTLEYLRKLIPLAPIQINAAMES